MERENEMIVISHRLVLFPLSIFLLALLSHVSALMSERFMLFLLGRLVHAGRHDLLLRLACLHAADIPLLIIAGDGLFNGFFQLSEKESILRRRIGDGDPLRTGAAGAADAMDIVFEISWNPVIEDMRNAFDVKPACRDIGGNEHLNACFLPWHGRQPRISESQD